MGWVLISGYDLYHCEQRRNRAGIIPRSSKALKSSRAGCQHGSRMVIGRGHGHQQSAISFEMIHHRRPLAVSTDWRLPAGVSRSAYLVNTVAAVALTRT